MAKFTETPKLGLPFMEALEFAWEKHNFQVRKQGEIPYLAHLMSVSSLVLEAGGNEDEAIAALLHDCVEDVGVPLDEVELLFGIAVGAIVEKLTEPKDKSNRKGIYVRKIRKSSDSAKLVSAADKLHNIRCYRDGGAHLWGKKQHNFYRALLAIYKGCDRVPLYWIEEMESAIENLSVALEESA